MTTPSPSTSDPRARHRERRDATRAALIESAMRSFHDRGYGPTTADLIATAIGQTKGAFYFHFDSKADCFLAVLEYRQELRGDWYLLPRRYDRADTSLEEILATAVTDVADRMHGMPGFGLAMIDFWVSVERTDEIEATFRRIHGNWLRELAALIVELQRGGWVDVDVDPEVAARQIHALVDGDSTQQHIYGTDVADLVLDASIKLLRP